MTTKLSTYQRDILTALANDSHIYEFFSGCDLAAKRWGDANARSIPQRTVNLLRRNGWIARFPNNVLTRYDITPAGLAALGTAAKS